MGMLECVNVLMLERLVRLNYSINQTIKQSTLITIVLGIARKPAFPHPLALLEQLDD